MSFSFLTNRPGSHSSTTEDQTHEITKHAQAKMKHFVGLDGLLHDIRDALDKSPSLPSMNRADAESKMKKRGVAIPFTYPAPESDANYKFAYEKPTTYNVIGSHALRTSIKTVDEYVVDLAIVMPSSLFQEKDYINYRYLHKRAFYLSVVASVLASIKTLNASLRYHYLDDDPLRPIIQARTTSESKDSKKHPYVIQVVPVLSDANMFPVHKMNIQACCIRKEALLNTTSPGQATPRYNSAILADINTFSSLKVLHECMSKCDGFREACILGALWLQKIGLDGSISRGGFGVHEWSMLMAVLFSSGGSQNRPLLSANLTSLQLFKATLQFLAKRDLTEQYLVIGTVNFASKKADLPVVLVAETGLNVLFKMSPRSYYMLNEEAKLASNIDTLTLDNQLTLLYDKNNTEPWFGCDIWLRIPIKSLYSKKDINQDSFTWNTEYDLGKSISDLLSQGLGDRATRVQYNGTDLQSWPISERGSFLSSAKETTERLLTFGIKLQEHNARRLVDQGPLIEGSDESKVFRAFWGDKSELRRFKDGRITETLIWDGEQPIIAQIVQYVLHRHLDIVRYQDYMLVGDELDLLLPFPTFAGSATVPFDESRLLFDKLSSLLKGLEKMPLPIKDVHPVDPVLRSTSVYASIDLDSLGDLKGFIDVSIDFEASQKWPDDLPLVQKGKIALFIRLAELLEEKEEVVEAKVGMEKNMDLISNLAFLDITMTEGLTYRVRAYCTKERDLAEQMLLNKTIDIRTRQEYQDFTDDRTRCVDQMSRHGQVVSRWCSKYAALSPVIRLFKKWVYSHLLSDHIPEELLELLVVNTFILPGRSRPASVFTGFLQTMEYLGHWPWQSQHLIVDFTGELSKGKRKELQTEFEDIRKHDPLMGHTSMVVAAAYDHHTRPIICKSPTIVAASRLTALAKEVCQQLSAVNDIPKKIEDIFTPSLKQYDFVLIIKDSTLSKRNKLALYKNVQYTDPSLITENSFLFNSFLSELQTIFSSSIIFFHDKLKRNVIAGLWYPQSTLRAKKYAHTYSSVPMTISDEKVDLLINKEAVLCEMRRLGDGLIKNIIVN